MIADSEVIDIRLQPRQETFAASPADIAIFGGAAGGGKTYALLIEPLRHIDNPGFGAVIFRRTIPEITHEGGLWDEAKKIYPLLDATSNENEKQFRFPMGSKVTFSHMQREDDKESWKSSQIPLIIFDQLEMFSETQFFYMLSRNRSMSGVAPYVRASCNPEPGWLADLLSWWIGEDGYAIADRSGVIRWMIRENDKTYWSDDPDELQAQHPNSTPKSVTFILSTVYDNKILLEKDPGYLANLQALSLIDRERLLGDSLRGGNWKIKPSAGKIFNRAWFEIVEAVPGGGRIMRAWDLAATSKEIAGKSKTDDPDYTASVKGTLMDGVLYILDVTNEQMSPARTDTHMKNIAKQDQPTGIHVAIRFEQEGGASGPRDAAHIIKMMAGYDIRGIPPQGDKITRAKPLAAQALAGNVKLLKADWNEEFLVHMHGLPDLPHDDICLVAGTMITAKHGDIPIENIRPGDYVLTRKGYRRVIDAGMTSPLADVITVYMSDGSFITGTKKHLIFTNENGFIPMDASKGCSIMTAWKKQRESFIRELLLLDIPNQKEYPIRTILGRIPGIPVRAWGLCIRRFGKTTMGLFRQDMRYIIKMAIRSTMILKTLLVSRTKNTKKPMLKATKLQMLKGSISREYEDLQKHGTSLLRVENGTEYMPKKRIKKGNQKLIHAFSVVRNFFHLDLVTPTGINLRSAQLAVLAKSVIVSAGGSKRNSVHFVKKNSWHGHCKNTAPVRVLRVQDGKPKAVYNISVEDEREYFANGILVHNCDASSLLYNEFVNPRVAGAFGRK